MGRLLTWLTMLLLLLCGMGTGATGKALYPEKTASGSFGAIQWESLWEIDAQPVETQWEETAFPVWNVSDVCHGPNVYTYVRQNPWSAFDPEGLAEFKIGPVYFKFFQDGIMGTGRMAGPGDSHVPQLFSINNAKERVTEIKKDPLGYARDVGKGYLNPLSPPDSDAGQIGSIIAASEAVISFGRNARLPGPPTPALATSNGMVVQGNGTVVVSSPFIAGGAILQNNQEIKPEGSSARETSESNAAKTGTAAAERAKNIEKGIPESQLGPSGKPKIHTVDHSSRKAAKDAARQDGKDKPIKHPSDEGQPPHYHAVDENGDKIGKQSPRHNYPRSKK